jgi:hypothetical protein
VAIWKTALCLECVPSIRLKLLRPGFGYRDANAQRGCRVASATVSFEVGRDQLSILDAQMEKTVEPGTVDMLLGPNSVETSSVRCLPEELEGVMRVFRKQTSRHKTAVTGIN